MLSTNKETDRIVYSLIENNCHFEVRKLFKLPPHVYRAATILIQIYLQKKRKTFVTEKNNRFTSYLLFGGGPKIELKK